VAKLAGIPDGIIKKAKDYLKELESTGAVPVTQSFKADSDQISFGDVGMDEVKSILCDTDINTITPIEALNLLFKLQKKAQG